MPTHAILNGIPYMVWTYDAVGMLDGINTFYIAYTGLGLAQSADHRFWKSILPSGESDAFIDALAGAMKKGKPFQCEARIRHRRQTDRYRWHAIHVEPNVSNRKTIDSWIGTAIDIDDRKQAERTLQTREIQIQEERARSTLFQQAVLPPHLPAVAGLTFDAVYEPGRSDALVGGDWYDAFRLLDGRVLLTIGDVAGSGLKAAVIMGVVRQIMRGIAQLHAEPAILLDAADRALCLEYPDAFVTAWVGVFDLTERTLTYASAGHPPPLYIEADGTMRELDHRTLPIGLRQGHQGHESTVSISHGSSIWLYTDGVIEATQNIVDGTQRLHDVASRLGGTTGAHPAATIRRMMLPEGSPDDVAILVVKTDFNECERHLTRAHFDSADAFAARSARLAFTRSLPEARFSEVDIANAEIVFGELCGNVARYAPGPIVVVVDTSGVQTVLHVLDRGIGFSHVSRLPSDLMSEHGRGLFIVAAMTTEFTVAPRVGGGSHARAVLVGRFPISLLRDETLPAIGDQVAGVIMQ